MTYDYTQYLTDAEITAQASYRIKDGAGGKTIFNLDKIGDIPRYKPSIGIKVIDIIMAEAGPWHPLVVEGKLTPDRKTHICWVFVHKGIGPNQDWFICLARTYHKPCPICEHRNKLMADPNITTEAANEFGSGKYPLGIYNIVHHLNPNQITWSEPVMIWDINNMFMESQLQSKAKQPMVTPEAPTGYINFMWPTHGPQGGRHISFEIKPKGQFFDYVGHNFFQRIAPVPEHIMSSAYCLSELLYIPTYEEMKDALEAGFHQPIGGQATGITYDQTPQWGLPTNLPVMGTPEPTCPFADYGGKIGDRGAFEECKTCIIVECLETQQELPPEPVQTPTPTPTAPVPPAPIPVQTAPVPPAPIPVQKPIPRRVQK